MTMSDIDSRLQSIEARLREAEIRAQRAQDQLDIYQLVATYGPSVDSLNEESVRNLWTEDGVYDPGGNAYVGNDAVGKLIYGDIHQGFVNKGCAHVMSMPHIVVDGDTAVATGYSNVFLRDGDHWRVERASANRWELVRTAAGWKVKYRLNRQLLGNDKSRQVLGSGLPPSAAATGA
jgi:hypothetical protein